MPITPRSFGYWLRRVMYRRDRIKQTQLAAALDLSRGAVTRWMKGQRMPGPERYDDLCEVLDLNEPEAAELWEILHGR